MRRFATALALVTLALSTAACDPYQALQDALPVPCSPAGESNAPSFQHNPDQLAGQHTMTLPAELPNTKH